MDTKYDPKIGFKMTIDKISVSANYCFGADPLLLQNLSKVNFVFAPNGSGKTTISNALASQPTDPASRSAWSTAATSLPIRVFNERYRELVLRERVDGIFTMGSNSGDAVDKITVLEAAKNARKKDREVWEMQVGFSGEQPSGLLGELEREKTAVREAVYESYKRVDQAVASIVFKKFTRNSKKLIEETLRRHELNAGAATDLTWKSIKTRSITVTDDSGLKTPMPNVTVSCIFDEAELEDLKSEGLSAATSPLSEFIRTLDNEDWVNEGRFFITNEAGCCPFCQQALPPEFEKKLEEHFSSGFDAQLQRVREIHNSATAKIGTLTAELNVIRSIVAELDRDESRLFDTLLASVDSACAIINARLEEKISHPTSGVEVNDVKGVVNALRTEVSAFNYQVAEHNRIVSNSKEELKRIVEDGWRLFLSEPAVTAAIKRYEGVTKKKMDDINGIQLKITDSLRLDSNDEDELKLLRDQISNTQGVAERINRTLKAMGFYRFHIVAESAVTGGYRIVRPDGSFAHKSLSEGEKSFLCFVYFWESLFGATQSGAAPEDVIAVFDDPISSLDSDTLFLVAAHIRQAASWTIAGASNLKQLIVLTHNTQFHHEAAYETDRSSREERHYYRLLKQVSGSTILKDDGNVSKIRGSYSLLWDSVVDAARSHEESSLVQVGVFNIVRRIIEGYFKTIGQVPDYQRPQGLTGVEEHLISMFHMWSSSGSHTIADDVDQTIDIAGTQQFLRLFRHYFDLQGHSAHFDMMLRASNGENLAMQGGVFEQWSEEEASLPGTIAS